MRIFNQLVFDSYINGTASVYSNPSFDDLLGHTDQLSITGYTAQVSGSTPKIEVQVEHSFDNIRWQNRNTTAEIPNATTLSTVAETPIQGHDGDPNARPTLGFARLRITLSAVSSTPAGQVRIWAIGRDRASG
ncbi:MAG TPA: hypothetical protein VHC69_09310 [Polyangiaceae bacterium]|nr:hypothetical protein [Polyangiaceae bacterium]